MKKTIQLLILIGLAAICTGCASTGGYFVDRGRDAADIFTAAIGVGAGAQARVGPVHAGLAIFSDVAGLHNGSLHPNGVEFDGGLFFAPSPCGESTLFTASSFFPTNGFAAERGKGYAAVSSIPFITTELQQIDTKVLDEFEGRDIPARKPIAYFTQLEAFAALGGGARIGFNPGELIDFILGWTTIDIFGDDLEKRKSNIHGIGEELADPQH